MEIQCPDSDNLVTLKLERFKRGEVRTRGWMQTFAGYPTFSMKNSANSFCIPAIRQYREMPSFITQGTSLQTYR